MGLIWLLGLILLSPQAGQAFYPGIGAKAIGLGGSFRALADDNSAIFYNPAGLTQQKRYTFGAGYSYVGPEGDSYLAGSVVDTKTSPLGAGVAYLFQQKEKVSDPSQAAGKIQELAVAVAQEYLQSFHLGLTMHYLWCEEKDNGWRLDASTLITPSRYFILGIIGKNLIHLAGDRREVNFALASRIGDYFNLDFDLIWLPSADKDQLGFNLGGELVARKMVSLRGGYSFDRQQHEWYGLGLGWSFPRGTMDYGFRREVGDSNSIGHWFEITVSI